MTAGSNLTAICARRERRTPTTERLQARRDRSSTRAAATECRGPRTDSQREERSGPIATVVDMGATITQELPGTCLNLSRLARRRADGFLVCGFLDCEDRLCG